MIRALFILAACASSVLAVPAPHFNIFHTHAGYGSNNHAAAGWNHNWNNHKFGHQWNNHWSGNKPGFQGHGQWNLMGHHHNNGIGGINVAVNQQSGVDHIGAGKVVVTAGQSQNHGGYGVNSNNQGGSSIVTVEKGINSGSNVNGQGGGFESSVVTIGGGINSGLGGGFGKTNVINGNQGGSGLNVNSQQGGFGSSVVTVGGGINSGLGGGFGSTSVINGNQGGSGLIVNGQQGGFGSTVGTINSGSGGTGLIGCGTNSAGSFESQAQQGSSVVTSTTTLNGQSISGGISASGGIQSESTGVVKTGGYSSGAYHGGSDDGLTLELNELTELSDKLHKEVNELTEHGESDSQGSGGGYGSGKVHVINKQQESGGGYSKGSGGVVKTESSSGGYGKVHVIKQHESSSGLGAIDIIHNVLEKSKDHVEKELGGLITGTVGVVKEVKGGIHEVLDGVLGGMLSGSKGHGDSTSSGGGYAKGSSNGNGISVGGVVKTESSSGGYGQGQVTVDSSQGSVVVAGGNGNNGIGNSFVQSGNTGGIWSGADNLLNVNTGGSVVTGQSGGQSLSSTCKSSWSNNGQSNVPQINTGQTNFLQTNPGQTNIIQTNPGQSNVVQTNPGQSNVAQSNPGQTNIIQTNPGQSNVAQSNNPGQVHILDAQNQWGLLGDNRVPRTSQTPDFQNLFVTSNVPTSSLSPLDGSNLDYEINQVFGGGGNSQNVAQRKKRSIPDESNLLYEINRIFGDDSQAAAAKTVKRSVPSEANNIWRWFGWGENSNNNAGLTGMVNLGGIVGLKSKIFGKETNMGANAAVGVGAQAKVGGDKDLLVNQAVPPMQSSMPSPNHAKGAHTGQGVAGLKAEVGVDGNILGKKVKAAVSAAAQATGGIHFHSGGNKVEDRVETRMGDEGPNGNSPESTAKEGVSSRFADNIEPFDMEDKQIITSNQQKPEKLVSPDKIAHFMQHAGNGLKVTIDKSGQSIQEALKSIDDSGKQLWKTTGDVFESGKRVAVAFKDFGADVLTKAVKTVFDNEK